MSSSEEYLDNLLKSLTDGNSNSSGEPAPSAIQSIAETDGLQEIAAQEESDTTMSMDDIEAMFASMGTDVTEEETREAAPESDGTMSDSLPLDDNMLSDELPMDDGVLSGELALDDGILSGELALDDGILPEELALDDGMMSDALALEEEMMPEELALDDGMFADELVLDESMLANELALDDVMLADELVSDDSTLSDEPLMDDELPADELMLDNSMLFDESVPGEEAVTDELAADVGMLSDEIVPDDNMLSDEPVPDDSMLSDELLMGDDIPTDEPVLDDEMMSDELSLDDSMLSDELVSGEELVTDNAAFDESIPDDLVSEESMEENSASEDLNLDELGLGDLGLEGLGLESLDLEEANQDESIMGGDFAVEDGAESVDEFALEETGEDDEDLSALLASMGGDEDLSEINELLEKSDQGLSLDDDMMAILGGGSDGEASGDSFDLFSGGKAIDDNAGDIREITPEELAERENSKTKQQRKKEERERKKREKKAKKAKNGNASQDENAGELGADDLSSLLDSAGETGDKPKEKGFLGKFIDFLLEEDEEEDEGDLGDGGVVIGNLSEENRELLAELQAEDKKNAQKKGKKDKKAKKGKKGKADVEDGEEEVEIKKPKKPKKEKKKKVKIEEEPVVPEKKLSKKKVISVFLFCATIAACIVVVTVLLPEQLEKQEARLAFDKNQYMQVYELLYGKELSEEDEILLHKSSTILQVQRKLDSYENYKKMGMPLEALDALIEGVRRYQNLSDNAALYNVSGEVSDIYWQMLDALADDYGLSEADALDIISSEDDVTYSQRIRAVISGEMFGADEQGLPEVKQDVLPEEEEIIDRLENTGAAE